MTDDKKQKVIYCPECAGTGSFPSDCGEYEDEYYGGDRWDIYQGLCGVCGGEGFITIDDDEE